MKSVQRHIFFAAAIALCLTSCRQQAAPEPAEPQALSEYSEPSVPSEPTTPSLPSDATSGSNLSNLSNSSNRSLRDLHGMVHCSGGAQTKVLHFIKDLHVIKDNLFPIPPLFRTIHEQSATDWSEMYKVFNMGHRLEVYLPAQYAQEVIDIARSFNIDAQVIGHVEARPEGAKVTLHTENGIFEYE